MSSLAFQSVCWRILSRRRAFFAELFLAPQLDDGGSFAEYFLEASSRGSFLRQASSDASLRRRDFPLNLHIARRCVVRIIDLELSSLIMLLGGLRFTPWWLICHEDCVPAAT